MKHFQTETEVLDNCRFRPKLLPRKLYFKLFKLYLAMDNMHCDLCVYEVRLLKSPHPETRKSASRTRRKFFRRKFVGIKEEIFEM